MRQNLLSIFTFPIFVSLKFKKMYKLNNTVFTKRVSVDVQIIYVLPLLLVNRSVNPFMSFT
jgi:hypothetical protein